MLLKLAFLGWVLAWVTAAAAAEHPRVLADKADVAKVRARCQQEPYASILKRIQAEAAVPPSKDGTILYDNRMRNLAAAFLLSGDKQFAAQAEKIVLEMVNDMPFWNNPGSKGLTRCAGALRVALTYDACYEAWPEATRKLVSAKLLLAADNIMKSMGQSANNSTANNWQAVRYGGAGIAFLASDEPGCEEKAQAAYSKLKQHLNANLGDNGWNPEGIGYTQYPWEFTGPFGIAAQRAGIGDLRKEVKKASLTFWTTFAGTVAIPRVGGLGLRADLSDDHPGWGGDGMAGMAFWYTPPEQAPGFKWAYDYLCGAHGDKSWDCSAGGGIYSLLYYPADLAARSPAEVPGLGLNYVDKSAGLAIFRNRFQDGDDIVAVVNGHHRQPQGCHGGPDTNTLRILGLGSCFVVGGGRTGDANGQTNLFPGAPLAKPPGGLGNLESVAFEKDGGGVAVTSGSCMGTQEHKRVLGVDYSGRSGAPAVFVDAETSTNGTLWRLNTPEFNEITSAGNAFTLTSPTGSTLVCTVLEPAKPVFNTGKVERGEGARHAGFPYREVKYINNKWIEFKCDKNVLVVMTLQAKGKSAPRIEGSGTAGQASLKIGARAVEVEAGKVTFAP